MNSVNPRTFISGASKRQMIGFALSEGLMICAIMALYIFRMHTLKLHRLTGAGLSFSRVLLNLVYFCGLCFTLSVFLLALISGIQNDDLCDTAIQLCLVFYLGGKVILYMVLCERLRAIRQGIVDRCADILWQRCFFGVLTIFGQICIVCFYYDLDTMYSGYCIVGLPVFITVPLLLFDILCNLVLSAIFYKQSRVIFDGVVDALIPPEIRRFLYPRIIKVDGVRAFAISKSLGEMPNTDNATSMMAEIIRKTLIVSILIWFTTIANLVLIAAYHGDEHSWLCFLTCSIDVTWNLSCLTYLIGLPTNHETPNKQIYNDRETNFGTLSLDIQARENPEVLDQRSFEAPQYPSVAPAYRMNETAAWAMASASVSSLQRAPESFELGHFAAPAPVLH